LYIYFIPLLEFHRGQSQVLQGDMFLPAMRDFQAQATCRLAEAEDLFQDMKTRVRILITIKILRNRFILP